MSYCLPDSFVHEISQARILEGLPFHSPGDLPNLGMKAGFGGGLFTAELAEKTTGLLTLVNYFLNLYQLFDHSVSFL